MHNSHDLKCILDNLWFIMIHYYTFIFCSGKWLPLFVWGMWREVGGGFLEIVPGLWIDPGPKSKLKCIKYYKSRLGGCKYGPQIALLNACNCTNLEEAILGQQGTWITILAPQPLKLAVANGRGLCQRADPWTAITSVYKESTCLEKWDSGRGRNTGWWEENVLFFLTFFVCVL